MTEFPNTLEAAETILEIIRSAQNRIILISPYADPSEAFFKELKAASDAQKQLILVCIESKLKPEVKQRLQAIAGLEILNHENVHAKAYYNEELYLQTSLNISKYSEKNNLEIGTIFRRTENQDRFYQSLALPEMIVQDAISRNKRSNGPAPRKPYGGINSYNFSKFKLTFFKEIPGQHGVCLRCHTTLEQLNGNFPLCTSCYYKWAKHSKLDFQERYCHWCGEMHPTSKRKPFCLSCFRKYQEAIKDEREFKTFTPKSSPAQEQETEKNFNPPAPPPIPRADKKENPGPQEQARPHPAAKRSLKFLLLSILVILLSLAGLFVFHQPGKAAETPEQRFHRIINTYYAHLNRQPVNVAAFYAPHVENFIKVKNLTPYGVDSLINKASKEFMYGKGQVLDSTFSIGKDPFGHTAVSFWVNFKCFRKSKVKYETCKVHEEFIFNGDNLILAVNELKITDLKFSFQDPDYKH